MAWQEWEQIKAEAAAKQPTNVQLNQVPAEGGGGGRDLVVHDDQLGKLGNMAYDLRERVRVHGDHARPSSHKAAVELFADGLDTGSALTALNDAWNTQLQTLKEACAHISNHLDYSRAQHAKDEADIATGMRNAAGELMTVSRIRDYLQ